MATDEPLGERAQCVLVAMLQLEAFDSDSRRSTEEIAAKALGDQSDANALKGVMAELKIRHLMKSKTGRGGGYWLTGAGLARAKKLSNHQSPQHRIGSPARKSPVSGNSRA